MKCNMCYNDDFKKVGERYVCTNCGWKYSSNEARNSHNVKSVSVKSFKKALILLYILFFSAVIIFSLVLINNTPLERFTEGEYTYEKLPDGTYTILRYSGTKSTAIIPLEVRGVAVTEINQEAFKDNKELETVIMHQGIKEIGRSAFYGCTSIKSITLPFVGGSKTSNKRLSYIFNDRAGSYESGVPSSLLNVYLLDSCTEIETNAFSYCSNLREIHIPDTVKFIEDGTNYVTVGVAGSGYTSSINNKYKHLPFYQCSNELILHCESAGPKEEWDEYWKYIDSSTVLRVYYRNYQTNGSYSLN